MLSALPNGACTRRHLYALTLPGPNDCKASFGELVSFIYDRQVIENGHDLASVLLQQGTVELMTVHKSRLEFKAYNAFILIWTSRRALIG